MATTDDAMRRTVLVAEDHARYRIRLVSLLEGWGLEAHAAEDGRTAIAALREGRLPDLLVTDLEMPHYTGFEVIDAWLQHGGSADRVIMVTGEADAADVRERCAAGSIRLVHKAAIDVHFEVAVRGALRLLQESAGDG